MEVDIHTGVVTRCKLLIYFSKGNICLVKASFNQTESAIFFNPLFFLNLLIFFFFIENRRKKLKILT